MNDNWLDHVKKRGQKQQEQGRLIVLIAGILMDNHKFVLEKSGNSQFKVLVDQNLRQVFLFSQEAVEGVISQIVCDELKGHDLLEAIANLEPGQRVSIGREELVQE